MSRITVDNLAAAIHKVRSMSLKEKEALADEIYLHQPHLLASCLVQSRLGVELDADGAREQYASQHPEQPLLTFVLSEANQWLGAISERNAEAESDKFVMMASMNLVNCIAGGPVSSAAHE